MDAQEIKQHIINVLGGDNLAIFLYLTYKERQSFVGKRADKKIYQLPLTEIDKQSLIQDRSFLRALNNFAEKEDDCFKDISFIFEGSSENVYIGNASEAPFTELFSLLSIAPEVRDFQPGLSTDGLLIQFQSDEGAFLTVKVISGRRYLKNKFLIMGTGVEKRTAVILDGYFDALKIDDCIVITKPNDLSGYLDLDEFTKERNAQALDSLRKNNVVESEGIGWFEQALAKSKSKRKKFLSASSSKVLKIPPSELLHRVANHSDYKSLFNSESGQIKIENEDDLDLFLKLTADSLLDSPITNARYDASVKKATE